MKQQKREESWSGRWQVFDTLLILTLSRNQLLSPLFKFHFYHKSEKLRCHFIFCGEFGNRSHISAIWLSPEKLEYWYSPSSAILDYEPICTQMEECATIDQLSDFAENLIL